MSTFIANKRTCPKCGKPYDVYVGIAPEHSNTAGEETFCTCAVNKKDFPSYYGWECPVCGRVYAPWVRQCDYCPKTSTGTTSTTVSW